MPDIHLITGLAVIASNLIAGVWGAVAWWRRSPSVAFWYLLRIAQVLVVVQVVLGTILLLLGHEASDGLHYVYGLLPLLVAFLAEATRAGMADRQLEGIDFDALPQARQAELAATIVRDEIGVMALSAIVVFGLALRAGMTSGGL